MHERFFDRGRHNESSEMRQKKHVRITLVEDAEAPYCPLSWLEIWNSTTGEIVSKEILPTIPITSKRKLKIDNSPKPFDYPLPDPPLPHARMFTPGGEDNYSVFQSPYTPPIPPSKERDEEEKS